MKNKSWLWIILAVLVAVFLLMYFKPAAPDAPVASVGNIVSQPTSQNTAEQADDEAPTVDEDDSEADDTDTVVEEEGQVDVVLPDAPLADVRDVDSFNNEIDGNGVSYALVPGSEVEWLGKKVGGQHNGYVEISEGDLYVEEGEIIEGRFVMDMTTIKATDIDDQSLDTTLMDWFNVAEHPTAEFFLNEAAPTQIIGVMTINGQSREISFPATVIVEEDTVIANADFALDRTQWGVDGGTPAVSEFMELSFNLTWFAQ